MTLTPVRDGVFVRRLSYREFHAMQSTANERTQAGDQSGFAFSCAIVAASACNEDGTPCWTSYDAVADDERPMLVADVAQAAVSVNGLGEDDAGNPSPDGQN